MLAPPLLARPRFCLQQKTRGGQAKQTEGLCENWVVDPVRNSKGGKVTAGGKDTLEKEKISNGVDHAGLFGIMQNSVQRLAYTLSAIIYPLIMMRAIICRRQKLWANWLNM